MAFPKSTAISLLFIAYFIHPNAFKGSIHRVPIQASKKGAVKSSQLTRANPNTDRTSGCKRVINHKVNEMSKINGINRLCDLMVFQIGNWKERLTSVKKTFDRTSVEKITVRCTPASTPFEWDHQPAARQASVIINP